MCQRTAVVCRIQKGRSTIDVTDPFKGKFKLALWLTFSPDLGQICPTQISSESWLTASKPSWILIEMMSSVRNQIMTQTLDVRLHGFLSLTLFIEPCIVKALTSFIYLSTQSLLWDLFSLALSEIKQHLFSKFPYSNLPSHCVKQVYANKKQSKLKLDDYWFTAGV